MKNFYPIVSIGIGKSAAQAARSGANLSGHTAKGFMDEMDKTARSPLLVSINGLLTV